MSMTGVMLVSTISVKFVGLFVIVYVGVNTIYDLWNIVGDIANSWTMIIQHFAARVLCLIIIPIILYLTFFLIHFQILSKTGQGDAQYGPMFQADLVMESTEFSITNRTILGYIIVVEVWLLWLLMGKTLTQFTDSNEASWFWVIAD